MTDVRGGWRDKLLAKMLSVDVGVSVSLTFSSKCLEKIFFFLFVIK